MLTARAPQDLPKKLAMACSSKFIITDPSTFFFDDEVNIVHNFSWNVTNDFPAIKILVFGSIAIKIWFGSISILALSSTFASNQAVSLYR